MYYLKGRTTEKERDRTGKVKISHFLVHSPCTTVAVAEPNRSQEPGALFWSSRCVTVTQVLRISNAAFPGAKQEIGSKAELLGCKLTL